VSILLIRHGETELNAARVVQPADTPLSARGRTQAARLAERLSNSGVTAIMTSDLPRAVMTAEALAATTGCALQTDAALQERNFGALRGVPYAQLREDIFAEAFRPPGGESWAAFHARVDRAWAKVLTRRAHIEGRLAVVTHGLFCRSLVSRHVTLEAGQVVARFSNTGLTIIDPAPPYRVELLDCTAHLTHLSAPPEGAPV